MHEQAAALGDGVEAALPAWVERSVERVLAAGGRAFDGPARAAAARAGAGAAADVVPRMRALLATDVDEQWGTPLTLLREAVRHPTAVLRALGVPPVERDAFAVERFPDDDYDLTPASFADVAPELAGPGLAWGAAKAWTHRQRHAGRSR